MKTTLLHIVILVLISFSAYSQEQIHFQFSNPEIVNSEAEILQFDIAVKAENSGNFHRDFQLYINYNTEAFGENIIFNNLLTIIPLGLMANHYSIINIVDNTNSRFAIITQANEEMNQSASSDYFTELPTAFEGFLRVEIEIANSEVNAGITFDEDLMNGGQYLQSDISTEPLACANPNIYGNDLTNFSLFGLELDVNAGWTGLSSYMLPYEKNIETIMGPLGEALVIVQNFDGVYYPEANVNTLIEWDNNSGYIMKVSESTQVKFFGTLSNGGTVTLADGWNIIPVLSSCNVSAEDIFSDILPDLVVVKEIANTGVYWPGQGVNSLITLSPGKSYLVKVNGDQVINFPSCE